ncbi:MAG TPA: NAD(P)-binding domain-containing protein [Pseudolabrys sp.]|nr:NAD(P)-binding domain-containing protein [Pseudolabrys sp.]
MNIAIIGAGNVGGALGANWAQKGHDILFGVRDPKAEKTQAVLKKIGAKAKAVSPAEAAAAADFIVLSTPWPATEAAIRSMGNLKGKIVLDATNPLTRGPDGIALEIGHSISAGEKVQGWATGASVFKTLNTTGFGNMANPVFKGGQSVMFVAGDDAANKPKVIKLVGDLGFEVIDAGPLRNARLLEAHAMLWIDLALVRGQGRDFAFGILRR